MDCFSVLSRGLDLKTATSSRRFLDEVREKTSEELTERAEEKSNITRKSAGVRVKGCGVPALITSFAELSQLGVPEWLVRNVSSELGYLKPTAVQMQAIPAILQGRSLIVTAPTGSGKTMAFLIPLLSLLQRPGREPGRVLVLCPTRELSHQTAQQFDKLKGKKKFVGRSLDSFGKHNLKSKEGLKRLDCAISTPLKLIQLVRDRDLSLDAVRHLVIDEGDRLLHDDFVAQCDEILAYCTCPHLQMMVFSATTSQKVIGLAESVMQSPLHISIGNIMAACNTIEQKLSFVTGEDGKLLGFRQLITDRGIIPPCLVFCQDRKRSEQLMKELLYDGIFVEAIHSDRTKTERDNIVTAFHAGKIWVLIATDIIARGLDFRGVETVVNYDFPQTATAYVHRIGRTGRAGKKGKAITFFSVGDIPYLRVIVSVMRESGCQVPEWMLKLKKNTKNDRKRLEKMPLKRKHISTELLPRKNAKLSDYIS